MNFGSSAQDGVGSLLRVSGPVTLEHAERWRESLLAHRGDLRLDLSESGPWDMAGLQLILSAMKTERGRILKRVPAMLLEVANSAGTLDVLEAVIES